MGCFLLKSSKISFFSVFILITLNSTVLSLSCASPEDQVLNKISASKTSKNLLIFQGIFVKKLNRTTQKNCPQKKIRSIQSFFKNTSDLFPFVNKLKSDPKDCDDKKQSKKFSVMLSGKILTSNGFTQPVEQEVKIIQTCFDQWGCGNVPINRDIIGFIDQSDNQFSLSYGPCDAWIMNSTQQNIDKILKCSSGVNCSQFTN